MIDGAATEPFNIATLAPMGKPNPKIAEALKKLSRLKYGKDRRLIDMEIKERGRFITEIPKDVDGGEEDSPTTQ